MTLSTVGVASEVIAERVGTELGTPCEDGERAVELEIRFDFGHLACLTRNERRTIR